MRAGIDEGTTRSSNQLLNKSGDQGQPIHTRRRLKIEGEVPGTVEGSSKEWVEDQVYASGGWQSGICQSLTKQCLCVKNFLSAVWWQPRMDNTLPLVNHLTNDSPGVPLYNQALSTQPSLSPQPARSAHATLQLHPRQPCVLDK